MQLSRHNIISQITNSENYFIVNPLSGNADILEKNLAKKLVQNKIEDVSEFVEKGYFVDVHEEDKVLKQKYLDFIDARQSDEIQLFFVPWYTCNFNCSYCFQDEYTNPKQAVSDEVIDAFFAYIYTEFAGKNKYITIFGGEPFLNSPAAKDTICKILERAKDANLDVAIVTNGYHLAEYVDLLKDYSIREVQVTVDGVGDVHNVRRKLYNDGATFEKIVEGIDLSLQAGLPINLRMVVDKENINHLPELALFSIKKGWTKSPIFKTQLGRNYELHHCQAENGKLFSRISMYTEIYDLIQKYPEILEFHKPAYSIAKFLFEHGEMPEPLFDSCPGTKTEWAFDYTGSIYSCTATVGKSGEELGAFYPSVSRKDDIISEWEDRDVLSIEKCRDCNVSLACGGGCASVAKNNNGEVISPDCRPVKELLELGISLYFDPE